MFNNNNKIKIAMLKISDQNQAILEFYFSSAGEDHYTVVDREQADAYIMDYDYPKAKEHLAKIQTINNKPIALLSISEQTISNTIWLAKPLSAKALTDAADNLKQMLLDSEKNSETEELEPIVSLEKETIAKDVVVTEKNPDNEILEFAQSENSEKGIESLTMAKAATLASTKINIDLPTISEDNKSLDTENFTDTLNDEFVSLDTQDKDLEFAKTIIEEQTIQNDNLSEDFEDPNVETLLDSLLLDEDISSVDEITDAQTDEIEDNILDVTADSTDVLLKELTLEAEEITDNTNKTDPVETDEESSLLEEDFTLHDDITPSTEDTYANTLEVDLPTESQDSSEQVINNTIDELTLEIPQDDASLKNSTEMLEELSLENKPLIQKGDENFTLDDQLESNQFDFETLNGEEASKEIIEDDNDSSQDEELESDLDSLLKEVSEVNDVSMEDEVSKISVTEKEAIVQEASDEVSNINEDFESTKAPISDSDSSDIELQSLLNEIREEADKKSGNDSNGLVSNTKNEPNSYKKTNAEKRWTQLCGDNKEIENQKQVKEISFSFKDFLLDVLLKQIGQNKNKEEVDRLKYNDLIIVIDHSKSQIYCNLPLVEDLFVGICAAKLNLEDIKIHDLDYSEVRLYRKKIEENPKRAHSIESFIWTTTLLTSRGRLPEKTDVNQPVGLKAWPNLTRVELMPHAMQIAAVFSKHPASLLEIPKLIGVEQRYVFAFYNAALALNLIELDGSKLKKSSFSFKKNSSKDNKENRGFFGRLLKRLKS